MMRSKKSQVKQSQTNLDEQFNNIKSKSENKRKNDGFNKDPEKKCCGKRKRTEKSCNIINLYNEDLDQDANTSTIGHEIIVPESDDRHSVSARCYNVISTTEEDVLVLSEHSCINNEASTIDHEIIVPESDDRPSVPERCYNVISTIEDDVLVLSEHSCINNETRRNNYDSYLIENEVPCPVSSGELIDHRQVKNKIGERINLLGDDSIQLDSSLRKQIETSITCKSSGSQVLNTAAVESPELIDNSKPSKETVPTTEVLDSLDSFPKELLNERFLSHITISEPLPESDSEKAIAAATLGQSAACRHSEADEQRLVSKLLKVKKSQSAPTINISKSLKSTSKFKKNKTPLSLRKSISACSVKDYYLRRGEFKSLMKCPALLSPAELKNFADNPFSWIFITKNLQITHPKLQVSYQVCQRMEVLLCDIIYRIGDEAEALMTLTEKKNFTPRVLKYAIKLCLEHIKSEADIATGKKTPWIF